MDLSFHSITPQAVEEPWPETSSGSARLAPKQCPRTTFIYILSVSHCLHTYRVERFMNLDCYWVSLIALF